MTSDHDLPKKPDPLEPSQDGEESVSLDPASEGTASTDRLKKLKEHSPQKSRYQLKGEVARGGMGAILKVWDDDLRRHLAMKVVLGRGDASTGETPEVPTDLIFRFLDEAQITGQLDHPGVVPIHELGMDDEGKVYFTMQMVKGREFKQIIDLVRERKEGWTQTRALEVIIKVCDTLAYAHTKNVIHRDLKPDNIMVGKFGEVYVMDWGLAKVLGEKDRRDLRLRSGSAPALTELRTDRSEESGGDSPLVTMDGAVVGTPAYMPPEQAEGRIKDLSARSDVYSVGAMLYHVLVGHPPYLRPGARLFPHMLLAAVQQGPPAKVAEIDRFVPGELISICEKAMAREADRRYATVQEVAEDLRAFLDNRVVRAHRTGAIIELRKWVTRNKGLASSIATTFLALVIGLFSTLLLYESVRAEQERADLARRHEGQTADPLLVDSLIARATVPWPVSGEPVANYREWEGNTRNVLSRFAAHQEALSSLDEGSMRRSGLEALLKDGEKEQKLRDLIGALAERERLIAEHWPRWEQAAKDVREDERFENYELHPVDGLLPLARNKETGLWEFSSPSSGSIPQLAAKEQESEASAEGACTVVVEPSISIVMVLVPGRTADREPNPKLGAFSTVNLRPFFISKFELTQSQWASLGGASTWGDGPGVANPVAMVSWFDCQQLLAGNGLALPTEAQWEYACRAGTTTEYWSGDTEDDLKRVGWYRDNSGSRVHRGGEFPANAFGLHDVHGNLMEWCQDGYSDWVGPANEGDGLLRESEGASSRVCKGGCFRYPANLARSAYRFDHPPDRYSAYYGVRPALIPPE